MPKPSDSSDGMALRKAHANIDGLLTDAYLRESALERVRDGIERFRRSAREAFCVLRARALIHESRFLCQRIT